MFFNVQDGKTMHTHALGIAL